MIRASVRCSFLSSVFATALAIAPHAFAEAWSFGVMSDTQWSPAEGHPGKGVPIEIIDDVNQQFIKAGVKFVVQVGDITQNAGKKPDALDELDIRAAHNAALTAAGIGYYPFRGNHEGTVDAAVHFGEVFPYLPGAATYKPIPGFSRCSSPDLPGLAGRTYAFTYRDATFVLLDIFTVADGSRSGIAYPIADQLPWITTQLHAARSNGEHAFVFCHKNLLGQQHKDNAFGTPLDKQDPGDADPAKLTTQVAFIRAMDDNGVRLYMSGHDHIYHRAMVSSPEPAHAYSVQQIITGSCSYKFYEPHPPYSANERPLVQERNAVGYNIVTIDGPRVVYRYYSAPMDIVPGDKRAEIPHWVTPSRWNLQDEFSYSLNGQQFTIGKGANFTAITDHIAAGGSFCGTKMAILDGTNVTTGTTLDDAPADRRPLANRVCTGWTARPNGCFSDVLSLWGMRDALGSDRCDPYVLAMSYDPAVAAGDLSAGHVAICRRNDAGQWVNAASGGPFVLGAYHRGASVGSWGVDTAQHTIWALLDREGDFVVSTPAKSPEVP